MQRVPRGIATRHQRSMNRPEAFGPSATVATGGDSGQADFIDLAAQLAA